MKKQLQIFLYFAMVLLLWDATGWAAPVGNAVEKAPSIQEAADPTTYPAHLPGLLGTPFQGETLEYSGRTAQTASAEDSQVNIYNDKPQKQTLWQTSHYLFSVIIPPRGIRIKKLIFPFHTHL
jgi:hypothetical protein